MRLPTRSAALAALMLTLGGGITPAFAMLQPTGAEAGAGGAAGGGQQNDGAAEAKAGPIDPGDAKAAAGGAGAGAGAGAGGDARAAARRSKKDLMAVYNAWFEENIDLDHPYTREEKRALARSIGLTAEQFRVLLINYRMRHQGQ